MMSEAESDENDERVRKDKQSVIKELKHKPKHFHAQNLSFEGLLNMLSRKDAGSETYKSQISRKWGELVHRATRANKLADQQPSGKLLSKDAPDLQQEGHSGFHPTYPRR